MKKENVKKCLKCGKTFHGFNSCPYCGSTKIDDTGEVVEVEIKRFKKVEEKIELTPEEKEKRKKHAFKRNIILSALGALMILIIMLCVFLVYIPNNTQKLVINSFDGNTSLVIEDFKLGKNADNHYGWTDLNTGATIEVKDPDVFYEKYLKKYTLDEFESTKEKGYLFYDSACFYYKIEKETDYGYCYRIESSYYNSSRYLSFITSGDGFWWTGPGLDYQGGLLGLTYTEFINLLSHVDNRYYEVHDGKYYLKAYIHRNGETKFATYLELKRIDKKEEKDFCQIIIHDDNGEFFDENNPLLF